MAPSGCCRRRLICLLPTGSPRRRSIRSLSEPTWRARRCSTILPRKTDFRSSVGARNVASTSRRSGRAWWGMESSAGACLHRYFCPAAAEMNQRERDLTRAMLESLTPTEIFLYIRAAPAAAIERGSGAG